MKVSKPSVSRIVPPAIPVKPITGSPHPITLTAAQPLSTPDVAPDYRAANPPPQTTLKVGTLNINGLANKSKLYKSYQYMVAEEIDLLLIQEIRNCDSSKPDIDRLKGVAYVVDPLMNRNGLALYYN